MIGGAILRAFEAPTGEGATLRKLAVLILLATAARLLLAATLGLGIDEAYTVATARTWVLSTFDHPPMTWWLAHGAAALFDSEKAIVVRAPFILASAATTWFLFDAGRTLYTPRAGLFAAVVYTLSPVLAWTSGTLVLPDGPLDTALSAGLCCLVRALFGAPDRAWRWWLLAGVAAGFACLAKLHGVFLLAGTGLFLLTAAPFRRWLISPWPYLAAIVALVLFAPVLVWNAEHDWISFTFQAARAHGHKLDLAGPFVALAGQALFIAPWVWVALVLALVRAAGNGPSRARDWLLLCLAIGPIAVFTLVTLGGSHTLYHWAAPGYLFACVLAGRDVCGDLDACDRVTRAWLRGSTVALAALFIAVVAMARLPWPALTLGNRTLPYPLIEAQSWSEVPDALAERGLLGRTWTYVAGLKWHETARLDVAFADARPVRCLCAEPHGYGLLYDNREMAGHRVVVVTSSATGVDEISRLAYGAAVTALAPITIHHAGRPVTSLQVFEFTMPR